MSMTLPDSKVQPVLLLDSKGQIKQFNEGFEKIFFPVQPGSPLSAHVHPEDREDFLAWFKSLPDNGGEGPVKTLRMINPSGNSLPAMVRPEILPNGDYALWFWEGRAAREGGGYWQTALTPAMEAVFSGILDGAFILDVEGKVVEVNQALCSMLGFHKYELIGLPVGKLFAQDPQEMNKATARFARIMKAGRVQEVNFTLRDRAGGEIEVSLNGAVIRGEGSHLVGILGIVRDLRESKIMSAMKEKAVELEAAMRQLSERDKVKDDFLSVVGHELRTPLANIMGYAEFLLEGELNPAEKKEFIQVVYQESRRLARLVNEILDMSRLEAGRLIYHYVPQPIDPVLNEVADSIRAEAEQKSILITRRLNCELEIWMDRDRIKQVVINLLNNAVKYSPSNTEVRIESESVDDGALVKVSDQGIGIEGENLTKVFEKFHRVTEVEHHTQGAGLGLPIAKRIIEEGHAGRIWLESPGKNKGSTFRFWLPRSGRK